MYVKVDIDYFLYLMRIELDNQVILSKVYISYFYNKNVRGDTSPIITTFLDESDKRDSTYLRLVECVSIGVSLEDLVRNEFGEDILRIIENFAGNLVECENKVSKGTFLSSFFK